MSPKFIADPPLPVERTSLKHLRHLAASLWWILWQVLTPFKSRPEAIDDLPEPAVKVTEAQVKQCQWIFDQAAARRLHLEQKAQSTFGLMLFLVPLLASLFVFVISKSPASRVELRLFAAGLLSLSAVFLFLGFIAAVRAISVKAQETLYVHSVIDDAGKFREYKEGFHARGLLYCAVMNEAMNDHIAQFVKGAHVLTAAAVIAVMFAAVPTGFALSAMPASPAETKIVGPVNVAWPEVLALHDEVDSLKADVEKLLAGGQATASNLKHLEEKLARLDGQLAKIQRAIPAGPAKSK
jgi:hypothetical protein